MSDPQRQPLTTARSTAPTVEELVTSLVLDAKPPPPPPVKPKPIQYYSLPSAQVRIFNICLVILIAVCLVLAIALSRQAFRLAADVRQVRAAQAKEAGKGLSVSAQDLLDDAAFTRLLLAHPDRRQRSWAERALALEKIGRSAPALDACEIAERLGDGGLPAEVRLARVRMLMDLGRINEAAPDLAVLATAVLDPEAQAEAIRLAARARLAGGR